MAQRQHTLVILSPGFPENEEDSTCLAAHQVFVRALNRNFPDLKVVILALQYPFVSNEYTWHGNRVISFNGGRHRKIGRLLFWGKVWAVLNILHKENDLIGLLGFWFNEYALVGKYFGKVHYIKHYSWITGQDAKMGNLYVKLVKPKPGSLIAMSDFLARQFYTNYKVKPAFVVPNGIDIDMFGSENLPRCIDVFAAGSLIPLKRYDDFVDVVNLIVEKLPNVQAVLCGKGPEENSLAGKIAILGLEENIQLAGERKHHEVLGLMQQSKVFLHTSNYEGFSTVCLEALYAGAHVVSFFRPMEKDIEKWHIVQTKQEMANKALEILFDSTTEYKPVLAYSMDGVVKQIMHLYL